MSKAERRAFERCPISGDVIEEMRNEIKRAQFVEGYHQAEKDLELTCEDVCDILNIYEEVIDMDFCEDIYGEVLKRFHEKKNA